MPKDALTRRRGRRPAGFCQEQTLVIIDTQTYSFRLQANWQASRPRGRGARGLSPRKALTQPCSSTSARSNRTTSFSTVSTFLIAPWSAKKRVLMLYFNTPMGATLMTSFGRTTPSELPNFRVPVRGVLS